MNLDLQTTKAKNSTPDQYNEDYWRIADTVFSLENTNGHLRWSVSELARKTKYSRTLLYYHFGSSKKRILDNCLSVVAHEFYGLSAERMSLIKTGQAMKCISLSRTMFRRYPNYLIFYTHWRHRESDLRDQLIQIETAYQNKLRWIFSDLNDRDIESLHACLQGLVSAPFLKEEAFWTGLNHLFSRPPYDKAKFKSIGKSLEPLANPFGPR